MKRYEKWIAAGLLLLLAGIAVIGEAVGVRRQRTEDSGALSETESSDAEIIYENVGGASGTMSDDATKLFLEGYFGKSIASYRSYDRFSDALAALDNGSITSLWATDLTAEYLEKSGDYRIVRPGETPGMGDTRFSFAFAFRPEEKELLAAANRFLAKKREDGTTAALLEQYEHGESRSVESGSGRKLYVGITGAVPPLEYVSEDGMVNGMAAVLAADFAEESGRKAEFRILDGRTALVELMAGRVDMLAVYGTSENHSLSVPKYRTSIGYADVCEYCLIMKKEGGKNMSWLEAIKENLIAGGAYRLIIRAALVTAVLFILSCIAAACFGFLFRRMQNSGNGICRKTGSTVAFLFRSIPVLLLLWLFYYGPFGSTHVTAILPAALALGLFGAGLLAESADMGVKESTKRLTLSEYGKSLCTRSARRIAITLLQWTTVAGYLGVNDLTEVMRTIGNRTMYPLFSVICSIIFYLIPVVVLSVLPTVPEEAKTAEVIGKTGAEDTE